MTFKASVWLCLASLRDSSIAKCIWSTPQYNQQIKILPDGKTWNQPLPSKWFSPNIYMDLHWFQIWSSMETFVYFKIYSRKYLGFDLMFSHSLIIVSSWHHPLYIKFSATPVPPSTLTHHSSPTIYGFQSLSALVLSGYVIMAHNIITRTRIRQSNILIALNMFSSLKHRQTFWLVIFVNNFVWQKVV